MEIIVLLLFGLLHVFDVSHATPCPSSTVKISVNSTPILIDTPDFPDNYPRPLSCTWLLSAGENEVINFRVLTFDVFPSIFCYRDLFDMYDGQLKYSPVMQSWCGTKSAGSLYKTTTEHSLLAFQAVTVGDAHQGFQLEVWSEVKYDPAMGEVEFGPVNLILAALAAFLTLLFLAVTVFIVSKEYQDWRKKQDDDD